jgi:hypothetical protein
MLLLLVTLLISFNFVWGISGVLLPLALLLLLAPLIISFAGPSLVDEDVFSVTFSMLPPLLLLPDLVFPGVASVVVVDNLLLGAGVFLIAEDVFFLLF